MLYLTTSGRKKHIYIYTHAYYNYDYYDYYYDDDDYYDDEYIIIL